MKVLWVFLALMVAGCGTTAKPPLEDTPAVIAAMLPENGRTFTTKELIEFEWASHPYGNSYDIMVRPGNSFKPRILKKRTKFTKFKTRAHKANMEPGLYHWVAVVRDEKGNPVARTVMKKFYVSDQPGIQPIKEKFEKKLATAVKLLEPSSNMRFLLEGGAQKARVIFKWEGGSQDKKTPLVLDVYQARSRQSRAFTIGDPTRPLEINLGPGSYRWSVKTPGPNGSHRMLSVPRKFLVVDENWNASFMGKLPSRKSPENDDTLPADTLPQEAAPPESEEEREAREEIPPEELEGDEDGLVDEDTAFDFSDDPSLIPTEEPLPEVTPTRADSKTSKPGTVGGDDWGEEDLDEEDSADLSLPIDESKEGKATGNLDVMDQQLNDLDKEILKETQENL